VDCRNKENKKLKNNIGIIKEEGRQNNKGII